MPADINGAKVPTFAEFEALAARVETLDGFEAKAAAAAAKERARQAEFEAKATASKAKDK